MCDIQRNPSSPPRRLFGVKGTWLLAAIIANATCAPLADASSQWTWVSGAKTANAVGIYGRQNVSAIGNIPGARAACVTWTDSQGGLWLFGGYGNDVAGMSPATSYLSDLWSFNPQSRMWTWVRGSTAANAVGRYGAQGVAAADNNPGGRTHSVAWTDPKSGAMWLFGGFGFGASGNPGYLNDLWRYDSSTGNWTWVSGAIETDASGVYEAPGNIGPGAREGSVSWIDKSTGTLWLFGGYGYDSTGATVDLNDLWKFEPLGKKWTWVGGGKIGQQTGVYGTKGVAAAANQPGSRRFSVAWVSSGKLWLFGGIGYASADRFSALNDLWQYDPSTNKWTWMSGGSSGNANGVYGNKGVSAANGVPGARSQAVSWTDGKGAFWLFSGNGFDSADTPGSLNDLWKYDSLSNRWTWVAGANTVNAHGAYGARGVADVANDPGARQIAAGWVDADNAIWLFGGYGYDSVRTGLHFLSDLWLAAPQ